MGNPVVALRMLLRKNLKSNTIYTMVLNSQNSNGHCKPLNEYAQECS